MILRLPKLDDPAALKALASKRSVDSTRWCLTGAIAANVRKIAAILGIQYRPLDDGEFSHISVLILLNADSRIATCSEVMNKIDADFTRAIKQVLGKP